VILFFLLSLLPLHNHLSNVTYLINWLQYFFLDNEENFVYI